jgi:hypothetical protein
MAGTGFHSVEANCTQMCTADCHEENNLTAECHAKNIRTPHCHEANNLIADCHSQESKFESGLPSGYSCCDKLRYTWEWFANGLFLSWQTVVY